MYEKYHEAADALRQERWGRKHAESILERVIRPNIIFFELKRNSSIICSIKQNITKLFASNLQPHYLGFMGP